MDGACPLVSILVPLYNHAGYIRQCLDSIVADGYPSVEILIIDDGSRDNSVELARIWYQDADTTVLKRFELVSRPNKGVTKTLNELVAMARGEYVALLASDDFLLPGGIQARLEYLLAHSDKLAVFSDCVVVDGDGKITHISGINDLYHGHTGYLLHEELLPLELILNWSVPGPAFMARRELYRQVGLYDESLTVEDWDMYLRIASRGMLGFIPGPVAAYRFHGGNSVLDDTRRLAQLDSLLRTAKKNAGLFTGAERDGLLSRYFFMKHEMFIIQKQPLKRFIFRKIYKILQERSQRHFDKIKARIIPRIDQCPMHVH